MSSMEIAPKKSDISRKHLLAIDYGRKYTGLSNYKVEIDPMILMFGRLKYESDEILAKEIVNIVQEEFIDILILGIPRFTDGKESTMTKTILAFGEILKKHAKIPVYYIDETLTTFEAEERMKNDPRFNFKVDLTKIDALSATIILEQFVNIATD
jgi:putative Holliday junction resolvase